MVNRKAALIALFMVLNAVFTLSGNAQIASGGPFDLHQSVIGAGSDAAAGGNFKVTGTSGQPIAGHRSFGTVYSIHTGFWNGNTLAPAARVSITGRVTTSIGRGISFAKVTLMAPDGSTRSVSTPTFGFFRFDDVEVGGPYTLTVSARRYQFQENTQVIYVFDQVTGIMFVALPQ